MAGFILLFLFGLIVLPPGFWWGVLASLIATFLAVFLGWLLRSGRRILRMYQRFSLAGIWMGTCELPNYPPGVVAIEIYRLVVRGDHVSFKFFNYRPDIETISKYRGAGICRAQLLSAYYYIPLPHRSESGVFAVRKIGEMLRGVYAQYDLRANEELKVSPENFFLMRVELPWWKRLRMIVDKPPYRKHDEVEQLYKRALAANALLLATGSPETAAVETKTNPGETETH
jgi:hypothetical protein